MMMNGILNDLEKDIIQDAINNYTKTRKSRDSN